MALDFSLRIYYQGDGEAWQFADYEQLPVGRPCIVVLHRDHAGTWPQVEALWRGIEQLLDKIMAAPGTKAAAHWQDLAATAEAREATWLHALVCSGTYQPTLDESVIEAAQKDDGVRIMPIFQRADETKVQEILGKKLGEKNVAFWEDSIDEVALTVLARAGVTTLDRRVFISYRRSDTSPMADQLFDALTRRNFSVFLDRVSVEPGVNFQASLFEQLADKSMVVLLNSLSFPQSRWTMDEVRFADQHRLSLLICRLPDATKDLGATLATELPLDESALTKTAVPGFDAEQWMLKPEALAKVMDEILFRHDTLLIGRLRDIRRRVLDAGAQAAGKAASSGGVKITAAPSRYDSSIAVERREASGQVKNYTIYPSAYPPNVPELYDASESGRSAAEWRVVVGHTASILPQRGRQLDWVVKGRNVRYHNIELLEDLFELIEKGTL